MCGTHGADVARCGHIAGPRKPTWMPTWCLHGVNSDIERTGLNRAIGRSGLNRAIGRSGLNCAIGRLRSHELESASWATIPLITRDLTAEITRSEIRVTIHQFRAIRRLKSHGVKSASWATIHQFRTTFSINRCSLCKLKF